MKKLLLMGCLAALFTLPAQATDEEALQLAREVIKLSKEYDDELLKQQKQEMREESKAERQFEQDVSEERRAEIEKLVEQVQKDGDEMDEIVYEISKEKLPAIYAKIFTIKELKAMKAFYESPEGRFFTEKRYQAYRELRPFLKEALDAYQKEKKAQEEKEEGAK